MKIHVWNVSSCIYNVIAIWGWGVKCKLVTCVTREHVTGGRDWASKFFLPVNKFEVLVHSMFPYCKSWIKYHKWNLDEYFLSGIKLQTVLQVWSLFHPWNVVKFNPWKFISWKFKNDISCMFIHNMEYNLLPYFAKFIVPVSQVHFAKSQTQIDIIFYRISKSTLFQF